MNVSEREISDLRADHTVTAIKLRLSQSAEHSYLRDFVYGGIDGAVTTFAVVSGVAGAELSSAIVIVLGAANLVGDGFSMAASNYLGSKADLQLLDRARQIEQKHIDTYPEGEREEIRQILQGKGFSGQGLEDAVDTITADRDLWINTMLQEEYGYPLTRPNAVKAAFVTFGAFVIVGLLPLLAFFFDYFLEPGTLDPFSISAVLTGGAFFVVGAIKSRYVSVKWWWAGLETLFVGGVAAGLAWCVGFMLRGLL